MAIKNSIRKNGVLLSIITATFLASIAYSFYFRIQPRVDARAYDVIAMRLVGGLGYREDLSVPIEYDKGIVRVGPVYEFFLAGIYKVFGRGLPAVWIIQAIIRAASVYLIYRLCFLIFGEKTEEEKKKIGLVGAAVFAFYPDLVESSAMLMIETLYLFFFLLLLYIFFKFFGRVNYGTAAILGFITGVAAFTRPPIIFLSPIIIFYIVRKAAAGRKLRMLAAFLLFLILVFIPWNVRNYKVFGRVAPLGVGGAYNFWIGNYHGGDGEQGAAPQISEYFYKHSVMEVQDESVRQFKRFVSEYPGEFIKLTFLRINKFWSVVRPMGFWDYFSGRIRSAFILSSAAASVLLFIFGIWGALKAFSAKHERSRYLLWFFAITPLILYVSVVETRYRFQIYPLLAVFAGFAIALRPKFWRERYFWTSFGLVVLNGLIDLLINFDRVKDRFNTFF